MSHPRYNKKYTMSWDYDQWAHHWEAVGEHGGAHLHIKPYKLKDRPLDYSAGVEIHYGTPPESMRGQAPHHNPCFLLHGPCWTTGSSTYATDVFVPMFRLCSVGGVEIPDHDRIFAELESFCDRELARDHAD